MTLSTKDIKKFWIQFGQLSESINNDTGELFDGVATPPESWNFKDAVANLMDDIEAVDPDNAEAVDKTINLLRAVNNLVIDAVENSDDLPDFIDEIKQINKKWSKENG